MSDAIGPIHSHVGSALESGDITVDEMNEVILQFSAYSGFPKGEVLQQVATHAWDRDHCGASTHLVRPTHIRCSINRMTDTSGREEESSCGELDGQVAFITGAGRGQGRAHAVRLAREGVDVIGIDICANVATMTYPNATESDLEETVRLVEKEGRRMIARKADVRDYAELVSAVEDGVAEFGRLDIIIANAGIVRIGTESDDFLADWNDVIDTNLTGVYHTVRAALPAMRDGGRGGSIVITSSTAGLKGTASLYASGNAYAAAKRGVVAPDAEPGELPCPGMDSGQHHSSHRGAQRDDRERHHEGADGTGRRRWRERHLRHAERPTGADAGARGRRQRRRVPGLRRGQVHHRHPVAT